MENIIVIIFIRLVSCIYWIQVMLDFLKWSFQPLMFLGNSLGLGEEKRKM